MRKQTVNHTVLFVHKVQKSRGTWHWFWLKLSLFLFCISLMIDDVVKRKIWHSICNKKKTEETVKTNQTETKKHRMWYELSSRSSANYVVHVCCHQPSVRSVCLFLKLSHYQINCYLSRLLNSFCYCFIVQNLVFYEFAKNTSFNDWPLNMWINFSFDVFFYIMLTHFLPWLGFKFDMFYNLKTES